MRYSDSDDDLEKIVFGESSQKVVELIDNADRNSSINSSNDKTDNTDQNGSLYGFVMDTQGSHHDEKPQIMPMQSKLAAGSDGAPLWVDPDDENLEVDIVSKKRLKKLRTHKDEVAVSGSMYTKRLRTQYEEIYGNPSWLNNKVENDEQRELFLTTTNSITTTKKSKISLLHVKDANKSYATGGILNAVEFHPNSTLILTGGLNKRVDLFKIDGRKNAHMVGVTLDKFPVYCSHFNGANEFVASSRKPFFYVHDLVKNVGSFEHKIRGRHEERWDKFWLSTAANMIAFKGEGGYIPLVCSKSKQWIDDLKISGTFNSGCFSNDGKLFYAFGNGGDIYCWDIGMRRCIYKFADEGCLCGSTIDIDSTNSFISTGSINGVVNIYDVNTVLNYANNNSSSNLNNNTPKPLKSIMNLTTAITATKFNKTGSMLFIASKQLEGAARIVDLSSQTVVCNWPSKNVNIGRIQNCDFSPDNKWMSVGNNRGRALLYRIRC